MKFKTFSPMVVSQMVRCVEEAVGDDIREDIRHHDLETGNSTPSRIWDFINTRLCHTMEIQGCTVAKTHRGPWEMLVIFEKTSQCVFTFMREKRFAQIQREQRKRAHMHYVDMLAMQFNKDLLADHEQMSIFPHHFSDEDRLAELVQGLLADLEGGAEVVRNHVLVLFDTVGFQLTHIRAVMVTPTLSIAEGCDEDWSNYISAQESVIVEKVDNPTTPKNQPNRGLTLKPKALARKQNNPVPKEQEKSQGENA